MSRSPLSSPTTWFCIRRNGARVSHGWIDKLPDRVTEFSDLRSGDVVEVCTAKDYRSISPNRFSKTFSNRNRGLLGMEVEFRGDVLRLSPTQAIAANLRFERALEMNLERWGITPGDFEAEGRVRSFSAQQRLLSGDEKTGPVELFRGSTLVPPASAIDPVLASRLADGIGQWMLANLSEEGALPYKYWPSRGVESPADNAIRRFLASLSLSRLGELRGSAEIREAARRNLRFNLSKYFKGIGGGRGAIVENDQAKLGAAAVAALAILESPARREFLPELTMLAAGVDSLADPELGFRTFFFPKERDGENWNFYSGEALLFWAEAIRRGFERAPSIERCRSVFERCRARHYQSRNPAFVPWHTQACSSLFVQTQRKEWAEFVFEMNDWLLPLQQWDRVPADMKGRFYSPRRPDFGPPHAASTGAYLESLAEALTLARALGETTRVRNYERAIRRGLRSLRQLQFRDWRDSFYVSRKKRVMGALRTEVYDNAIRIDSAAHALAAVIKVLAPETPH